MVQNTGTPHLLVETPHGREEVPLQRNQLTLGRDPTSDIVVADEAVAYLHALLERTRHGYEIIDAGGASGLIANGARIQRKLLADGDVVWIGQHISLTYQAAIAQAVRAPRAGEIRLDALHLKQFVDKKHNLLQDISLSVLPREFVAVVGVSGAGKSMLLNALSGFRPATHGAVLVNGDDLYRNYATYHAEIGYVPQEDIIHKELTIYEALDYSARLRLPPETTAAERGARVADVMDNLDIGDRRDRRIDRLSGGTRKRVSIGVELLTQPGLFLLDEATSGLDPGTESQLMRLLRKLADQGHTILLVTHATKNVMLCDQVAFLAKGGYLAYFGPPQQALTYFGVKDFDAIYEKLENELTPAAWAERYQSSSQFREFVVGRIEEQYGTNAFEPPPPTSGAAQNSVQTAAHAPLGATSHVGERVLASPVGRDAPPIESPKKRVSAFRQFIILSERNLRVLARDRASLVLMFLTPLMISALNYSTWKTNIFSSQTGDATQGIIDLYLLAINSVFVGALTSMREIVKEADVYKRERIAVLKLTPYVLSKLWLGVLLALYTALVFIGVAWLASGWPDTVGAFGATYLTLALTLLAGVLMGMLISALSWNQNVTPLLLIPIVIPQLLFGGGLLPLSTFGPAGQLIAPLTASKWSLEALVTISQLGRDVAGDACWALPAIRRDALPERIKLERCKCMGPNMFQQCNFPGIAAYYDPAIDTPELPQPRKPQEPPPAPVRPTPPASTSADAQAKFQQDLLKFQVEAEQYQKDIEAYLRALKQYGDDLDTWSISYQEWKETRDKAVGQAEGLIKVIYENFHNMFAVDLALHWGVLATYTLVLLGLIVLVQKRKDVI